MGYSHRILPRLSRWYLGGPLLASRRARMLAQVTGRVLEVGFGSGTSLPFYPDAVHSIVGLDRSAEALRLVNPSDSSRFQLHLVRGLVEQAPLRDHSFDYVVTTWLLCLLPDPRLALRRIRQLLAPHGTFLFLEHGSASSAVVRLAQVSLAPCTAYLCGGCHLHRKIDEIVEGAGFRLESIRVAPLDPVGLLTCYEGRAIAID